MTINTQSYLMTLLGEWRDRGYQITEIDDNVDPDDKLIKLWFKDKCIGTFYKSKLMLQAQNTAEFIQSICKNYWDNMMRYFTEEQRP